MGGGKNNHKSSNKVARTTTEKWIISSHGEWATATVHPFYLALTKNNHSREKFAFWLHNQNAIFMELELAGRRVLGQLKRQHDRASFSLHQVLAKSSLKLTRTASLHGIRLNSTFSILVSVDRFIKCLRELTSPQSDTAVSVSVIWASSLASHQGWSFLRRNQAGSAPEYRDIAEYMCSDSAIEGILDGEALLNRLLEYAGHRDTPKRANSAFRAIIEHFRVLLDDMANIYEGTMPTCPCGRMGHEAQDCLFSTREKSKKS